MTALRVEQAGPATTLQDAGRAGVGRWGVPRSGPVDWLSFRLAALLSGRDPADATVLEVGAGELVVTAVGAPVSLAVAGARATVRLGGHETTAPCVVQVEPDQACTVVASGWTVVAPAGRVDVPAVLGSRSHHPRSGLGPAVTDGTVLPLTSLTHPTAGTRRGPDLGTGALGVLPAPQTHLFAPEVLATLVEATWRTTTTADRMAERLDGPTLPCAAGHDIVSDGVVPGAVQVPGDGRPWVLRADHQPTGGYPKIAVLGRAALARLVRLPVGAEVRFVWTTPAAARAELVDALAAVDRAAAAAPRPSGPTLAVHNLVDGVSDGGP